LKELKAKRSSSFLKKKVIDKLQIRHNKISTKDIDKGNSENMKSYPQECQRNQYHDLRQIEQVWIKEKLSLSLR
jgi:hypothetical protein